MTSAEVASTAVVVASVVDTALSASTVAAGLNTCKSTNIAAMFRSLKTSTDYDVTVSSQGRVSRSVSK